MATTIDIPSISTQRLSRLINLLEMPVLPTEELAQETQHVASVAAVMSESDDKLTSLPSMLRAIAVAEQARLTRLSEQIQQQTALLQQLQAAVDAADTVAVKVGSAHSAASLVAAGSDIKLEDFAPNHEIGLYLRTVPLLAGKLSNDELARLGGAMRPRRYNAGQVVVREGDPADAFYIVQYGEAVVSRIDQGEIGFLKRGDHFGETALLKQSLRMATVTAKAGGLVVLSLEYEVFLKLFDSNRFKIQFAKRGAVAAEAESAAPTNTVIKPVGVTEKTTAQVALLTQTIRANDLFRALDPQQIAAIVHDMHRAEVPAGTAVIKQGDVADYFYVVERGQFQVKVSKTIKVNGTETAQETVVGVRGAGTSFGELALLYNSPRSATITALSPSIVWVISRVHFRRALTHFEAKKLADYVSFLSNVPEFTALTAYERTKIADALEEVTFSPGQVVIQQGDVGDSFYIIKSGNANVVKIGADGMNIEFEATLNVGAFFGELALRNADKRAATVTAVGALTCLSMDRNAFTRLMGPLADILKAREASYDMASKTPKAQAVQPVKAAEPVVAVAPAPSGSRLLSLALSDLSVIGTLGKGSFGFVQLVKLLDAAAKEAALKGKTFALKGIAKAQIAELNQQEHIMNEKNVMTKLDSDFLVKLWATMKDPNAIYYLLEPCLGGELFTLLRKRTSFTEQAAKFYAGCVVLGFEYMHSKDIIYRDLKPENLMIDQRGYIKIADFGFAKVVPDRTYTLCGTPDYLAPEVVSGQGHGKGVDWWTLGILIYEMVASYPPFYDDDPMNTYRKIVAGKYQYPAHFSADLKDLISKLLCLKPTGRLGVTLGGATAIKSHPWFADLDWTKLAAGQITAPHMPAIKSSEDLSNFEDYGLDPKAHFVEYKPGPNDKLGWDADF